MKEVFQEAMVQLSAGHKAVVATVVRTKGSTPQKPGAKLLVREDGTGVGTLGGGCVEGDIWFAAKELLSRGGSAQYREYELNEDLAAEDGLICGGTMFFLIDPIYTPEELLSYAEEIDAAYEGHGSVALASLIKLPGEDDGPLLSGAGTGRKLFIRQDGTTNGLTAPSALSQERLERDVYERFGIDTERIQMMEAHGTGTRLGDPIEFNALTKAFRRHTDQKGFCALGSVKTNIGHAATAAGIAGVLKILLALKYEKIPPSLHFENGNPAIDFEDSAFFVNTRPRDWPFWKH